MNEMGAGLEARGDGDDYAQVVLDRAGLSAHDDDYDAAFDAWVSAQEVGLLALLHPPPPPLPHRCGQPRACSVRRVGPIHGAGRRVRRRVRCVGRRAGSSVALSLCTTVRPLYTRFIKGLGASLSETTDNATEPDQEAVNDTVNDETVPLLRSSSEEILEFFRRN